MYFFKSLNWRVTNVFKIHKLITKTKRLVEFFWINFIYRLITVQKYS